MLSSHGGVGRCTVVKGYFLCRYPFSSNSRYLRHEVTEVISCSVKHLGVILPVCIGVLEVAETAVVAKNPKVVSQQFSERSRIVIGVIRSSSPR